MANAFTMIMILAMQIEREQTLKPSLIQELPTVKATPTGSSPR